MVTFKFLSVSGQSGSGQMELFDLIGRSGQSVQVDLTFLLDPDVY
jgi:hypothetical protein